MTHKSPACKHSTAHPPADGCAGGRDSLALALPLQPPHPPAQSLGPAPAGPCSYHSHTCISIAEVLPSLVGSSHCKALPKYKNKVSPPKARRVISIPPYNPLLVKVRESWPTAQHPKGGCNTNSPMGFFAFFHTQVCPAE